MRNDFETVMKTSSLHFSFGEVFLRSAKSKQACIPLSLSENVLCWLKESLRQASKKELVHFFEREQTSPKVTEAKERALCGSGKKSFPSRRPAGGTTQSTMQANAEAKRAWTMLSCEEKKMRSILTHSIVLRRCLAMENGFFLLRRRLVKSQPSTTQTSTATSFPNTLSTPRN